MAGEEYKLYVGSLNYRTRDNELRDFFAEKGDVAEAIVIMDKMTDRSRGFGFVTMGSEADMEAALELDNQELDGRRIKVNKAQRRENRDGGGRGDNRGRR